MDRDGELGLRERRADMGSHVVWAFSRVAIEAGVLRDQACKEIGQIGDDVRIGIFLNYQRCRRVLAENGKQSGLRLVRAQPGFDLGGEFVQAFASRRDVELVRDLLHSTVTLLAKLRG